MIEFECEECGVAMEAPDSQASKVEICPECKTPNRVPLLEPAPGQIPPDSTPGPADVTGNESCTNSANQDPGFLYVLVNSAMPGLIKVGKTHRDPEARAQELSGVTGIPTPFVVAYSEWFSDCAVAEDFVHAFLEANGYRIADNREFFSAPVKVAVKAIIQAKTRQPQSRLQPGEESGSAAFGLKAAESDTDSEPWADLLKQAEAAHYGLGDAVEDHHEAARLYKQAASLGCGAACLAMGVLCHSEEFGSDDRAAIKWFNEGVHKGDVECFAELALLYLERKQGENATKCFTKYTRLLDGQPVTDAFLCYCFRFLRTAVYHGIVIANIDEIQPYRDQIIQLENASIARFEARGEPCAGFLKAELLRVRYMLYGNTPDHRHFGKIKWWDQEKNFGFITGAGGQDLFLSGYQIVEGNLPPYEGQPVNFVPVMNDKGLVACVVILA